MSFSEIIFLSVLALLVFGPRRLPEIARLVGKTMGELRRASNEFRNSLEEEIRNIEYQESVKKAQSSLPPAEAETAAPDSEAEEPESPAPYSSVEHSVATDPYAMTATTPEPETPAAPPEHTLPADAAPPQDVPDATLQDHVHS
jgi:sec-independent protein translocase protein TatB